jgi:hypothetical protein
MEPGDQRDVKLDGPLANRTSEQSPQEPAPLAVPVCPNSGLTPFRSARAR